MVEHLLAKEKVAGSNPVFRSQIVKAPLDREGLLFLWRDMMSWAWRRGRGGKADATVLNTVGATRAGSNPAVRTSRDIDCSPLEVERE